TGVEITLPSGKKKFVLKSDLQGKNVYQGVNIKSVKAGRMVNGEFKPVKGQVTISGRGGQPGFIVIPEWVDHGLTVVAKGITDFAHWSKEMIDKFGDPIKEHLSDIWQKITNSGSWQGIMESRAVGNFLPDVA